MNIFTQKLKEVTIAVVPIALIVVLLSIFFIPIQLKLIVQFLIACLFIILGLSLFLIGVDIGITPLGTLIGPIITRKKKIGIVIFSGLILGYFISFAEPSLLILANQIEFITTGIIPSLTIMVVVSIGIAVMMVLGFMRILFNLPLYIILILSYALVFVLSFFTTPEFLAIAFDTSGATTGVLAVPFILALSLGLSASKKDSKSSEKDSFGLVAITSVGAIIAVMILNLFNKNIEYGSHVRTATTIVDPTHNLIQVFASSMKETFMAMFPLIVIFVLITFVSKKINPRDIKRISFGFIYAFIGLLLFFIGINTGFMDVGSFIGTHLAKSELNTALVIIAFILGFLTILAEPAVYVLTNQIEEVTSGYVKRRSVLMALSIGVGLAVALSMLRIIVPGIQLWHYLLPGYLISILLTFIVPKLFVGIAFDAGGVATGPMTATFILAFTQGAAEAYKGADVLVDGFGMIAMVALMPIITLQILGLVFKIKSQKKVVSK